MWLQLTIMYCVTKIYQKFNWTPSKGEGKVGEERKGTERGWRRDMEREHNSYIIATLAWLTTPQCVNLWILHFVPLQYMHILFFNNISIKLKREPNYVSSHYSQGGGAQCRGTTWVWTLHHEFGQARTTLVSFLICRMGLNTVSISWRWGGKIS